MNLRNGILWLAIIVTMPVFAQAPALHSGSTVYIEPMGGYETYLAAALMKEKVPLLVVLDRDKAAYVIHCTINHIQPNSPQSEVVISNTNTIDTDSSPNQRAWNQGWNTGASAAARSTAYKASLGISTASISVIDPHSSQIMFSYSSAKDGKNQVQRTAEDYAKHLRKFIEEAEKPKK